MLLIPVVLESHRQPLSYVPPTLVTRTSISLTQPIPVMFAMLVVRVSLMPSCSESPSANAVVTLIGTVVWAPATATQPHTTTEKTVACLIARLFIGSP